MRPPEQVKGLGKPMRKAGDVFKEDRQNYRQDRREQRRNFQNNRKDIRRDQRNRMNDARAAGAPDDYLQNIRKENRMQRQAHRNDYRSSRQNQAKEYRSSVRDNRPRNQQASATVDPPVMRTPHGLVHTNKPKPGLDIGLHGYPQSGRGGQVGLTDGPGSELTYDKIY